MAAFFVTFFIIFYNVLEMSAPYTDKYSKLFPKQPFSIRRYCQSCRFLALFPDLLQNPQ